MQGRWVLLTFLVVSGVLMPVAAAATDGQAQESYTYEELTETGTRYEDAPPSMRFLSQYGSATIRYETPKATKGWNYLAPGTVVNTNQVTFRTVRLAPAEELDRTLNVTVVFWKQGQQEIARGNTTVTRPAATNVSVYHHQVEVGRGYDTANITLPGHYESTYQVTMWVQEYPGARWRFQHHSVKTTQTVPFSTYSGFWHWSMANLWWQVGIAVAAVAIGVPTSIKITGRGPNMGLLFWAIVLGFGAMFIYGGAYVLLANVFTALPWLVAFVIAGLLAILMLETMEHNVSRLALIRLNTGETKTPTGSLAKEALSGEFETIAVSNTSNGVKALTDGIRPWIARLLTRGGPTVTGLEEAKTEFDLTNSQLPISRSAADKLLFIDDDADELIDYEREHLAFDLPLSHEDGSWNWQGIGKVALVAAVGGAIVRVAFATLLGIEMPATALLGAGLGLLVVFTKAKEGRAAIQLAEGNMQDAVATAMHLEAQIDEYETFEDTIKAIVDERNKRDDFLEWLEELDEESIIKAAHKRDTGDTTADGFIGDAAAAGGDD